jgi:hypothetical protein
VLSYPRDGASLPLALLQKAVYLLLQKRKGTDHITFHAKYRQQPAVWEARNAQRFDFSASRSLPSKHG